MTNATFVCSPNGEAYIFVPTALSVVAVCWRAVHKKHNPTLYMYWAIFP